MTTEGAPDAPIAASRLDYQPGLDGLRAVAVSLVLLFHGGWERFSGGYVGVSVFFTLSGYLITALLVREHDRASTISFRQFFTRRVKRLMPASLACLLAVSLLAALGAFANRAGLPGDIVASALQFENWHELFRGAQYADLIGASRPNPVLHFWSLSIEEQFYWIWPIAVLAICRYWSPARKRAVVLTVLAVLGGVSAVVIARVWGPAAAYLATPARFGEILVGAALAAWTHVRRPSGRAPVALGWAGIAIVLWAATTWPSASGPAYSGLLPIFALASAATIAGATVPGSLRAALSAAPLVALGRISFGVYLYHWPLFCLMTESTTGLFGFALFAVRLAATFAVAVCSYRFLEQPIRNRTFSPSRTALVAGAAVALVAAFALVAVPEATPANYERVDTGRVAIGAAPAPQRDAGGERGGPRRIVVVGDSAAVALAGGMVAWASDDPTRAALGVTARIGCGLARVEQVLNDDAGELHRACTQALGPQLDEVLRNSIDTAVITVGLMDSTRLLWSENEGWLDPTEPRHQEHLREDYDAFVTRLRATGVRRIIWLVSPKPAPWFLGGMADATVSFPTQAMVDTLARVAARAPDLVSVVRLDEWILQQEAGGDRAYRPDGFHLGETGAKRVMDEFLGDVIVGPAPSAP